MTPVQSALRAGSERCFHYLHHECKAKLMGHSKARENSLHFAVVGGGANALQTLAENLRTYAGTYQQPLTESFLTTKQSLLP